ncbi:MAG: hypothetical protein HOC71_07895 [Candidatus Latescibacteria bacterium]|jgi:hypothetical protein|nr:hypothetical protein [Desulfobacteraceae bacterium]MBT4483584.1 hypothetical protein [Candidatus Latescibacterota bacterium]
MNVFIGIGTIIDVDTSGRALKFNFSLKQERPCVIPCLVFEPDEEIKDFVSQSEACVQTVWLRGRVIANEFDNNGNTIKKIAVVTYPSNIKPID